MRHTGRLRALALLAGVVVAILAGCSRPPRPPPADVPARSPGSIEDAVLHDPVAVVTGGATTEYRGDGWSLSVPAVAGWRWAGTDVGSTVRLTRAEGEVGLELTLRAFGIREGMPLAPFLVAHRLWMADQGRRRIEYVRDEKLKETRGYSVGPSEEAYYAFRVAGDRGYVIEESAQQGVLGRAAADEFNRIVSHFRCGPRSAKPAR